MKNTDIRYRFATEADASALGRIQLQSMLHGYKDIVTESFFEKIDEKAQGEKYASFSKDNHYIILVAELEGKPIAFAAIGPNRGSEKEYPYEIYAVYVDPAHMNKGIGTKMLHKLFEKCAKRNWNHLILWCFSANKPSHACYQKAGGTKIIETPSQPHGNYVDVPHTAFVWHLDK